MQHIFQAEDIWSCESVDQYKEPGVQLFYMVYDYDAQAADFFVKYLTTALMGKIVDATSQLDVVPNPNLVLGCSSDNEPCWNHRAHVRKWLFLVDSY